MTQKLLDFISQECQKANVKTLFSPQSHVEVNGKLCNGFFSDVEPLLAVGTGKDPALWVPILLHEFNHLKQWQEQCSAWTENKITDKIEAGDLIDLHLSQVITLTSEQQDNLFQKVINVEKDCEERTVQFIKDHQLEEIVNPTEYTQKANSYVLFYHLVKKYGKWYEPNREPYNLPEIYKNLPDHFNLDYSQLDPQLEKILLKAYS